MSNLSREELQEELDNLRDEHSALDEEVEKLNVQVWMSPEDQIRQKELKKLKLKAKERMTVIQKILDEMGEA